MNNFVQCLSLALISERLANDVLFMITLVLRFMSKVSVGNEKDLVICLICEQSG